MTKNMRKETRGESMRGEQSNGEKKREARDDEKENKRTRMRDFRFQSTVGGQ